MYFKRLKYQVINLLIKFFIPLLIVTSCSKKDHFQPTFSFRSKENRISGKWRVVRLYYYDGALSGANKDGDTMILYREIMNDGKFNLIDSNGVFYKNQGVWCWLSGNQSYKNKEALVIGYHGIPLTELHIILKLKYNSVKSKYNFDKSDSKRYFIYEWSRLN